VGVLSLPSVDLRRDSFPLSMGSRGVCACARACVRACVARSEQGSVSWLRIFRVMRVVRVVRRLNSLRTITHALRNAAMPVLNAFCLLALVGGIYAVLAVQLYGGEE
jgi:hypothetical protein